MQAGPHGLRLRLLRHALLHAVPVDRVPPVGEVLALAGQAEVVDVRVLPGADAQDGDGGGAAGRDLGRLAGGGAGAAEGADGVLVGAVGLGRVVVGVDALLAVAGLGEGRAGGVGGQDAVAALLAAGDVGQVDEPDVARAEHGGRGVEHGGAQGVDGAEGADQPVLDVLVAVERLRVGRHALVEEVVVPRRAGVVEDGGVLRVARVLEHQVLDVLLLVRLAGQ